MLQLVTNGAIRCYKLKTDHLSICQRDLLTKVLNPPLGACIKWNYQRMRGGNHGITRERKFIEIEPLMTVIGLISAGPLPGLKLAPILIKSIRIGNNYP